MSSSSQTALYILLLIYISNQWSRYSIVYLGGVSTPECTETCTFPSGEAEPPLCPTYHCHDFVDQCSACQECYNNHSAAFRNIQYGTCLTGSQFGFLLSYGYIAIFAIMGLFAGRAADKYSRKNIIVFAAIGWSFFTFIQAVSNNFGMLVVSRLGMGFFHSFSGPASLSMIADLFPPEERARSNGIYTFGIYLGGGLSSLSLLISNQVGWRGGSYVIAGVGLLGAILLALVVNEPKSISDDTNDQQGRNYQTNSEDNEQQQQGEEEQQQHQTTPLVQKKEQLSFLSVIKHIAQDRCMVLLFCGAATRFLGGFAIGTFLPQFYNRRFPSENNIYSTLNAFIVSVGGATSAYGGGLLTDKLRPKTACASALVPAFASLLAVIPFFGVLYASNFYVSIACLFLEYLLAESWFGPAISIMQSRAPASIRGTAISIYLFIAGLVGALAPALLGSLDDGSSYSSLRTNLLVLVLISYVGSFLIFFTMAYIMRRESERQSAALLQNEH